MVRNRWFGFDWPAEMLRLQREMDRVAEQFGGPRSRVLPPINIYDDGESFHVRAELPGIQRESLDITAAGSTLTIKGERTTDPPLAGASYHRREREAGQFQRAVSVPQAVDSSQVRASYADGILDIVLPRAAAARPRKVPVSPA